MDLENNEQKLELLPKISEVLMSFGIRSVSMDDLAKHLKISKKTLYKYFKDKNDVVNSVADFFIASEQVAVKNIMDYAENAIDELVSITVMANQVLSNMNESVMFDLQKYYPEALQKFEAHKNVFITQCMANNLTRGISEGLYRANLNPIVIAKFYSTKVDCVWDSDVFPQTEYVASELHLELIRYHIRGIASDKGLKVLQEKIKDLKFKLL